MCLFFLHSLLQTIAIVSLSRTSSTDCKRQIHQFLYCLGCVLWTDQLSRRRLAGLPAQHHRNYCIALIIRDERVRLEVAISSGTRVSRPSSCYCGYHCNTEAWKFGQLYRRHLTFLSSTLPLQCCVIS